MNPQPDRCRDQSVFQGPGTSRADRRSDRRYPVSAKLEYRIRGHQTIVGTGFGRTIDISNAGVLFESGIALPRGVKVELHIHWPVAGANSSQVQVFAEGRTVRAQRNYTAVKILKYSFTSQKS